MNLKKIKFNHILQKTILKNMFFKYLRIEFSLSIFRFDLEGKNTEYFDLTFLRDEANLPVPPVTTIRLL